MQESVVQRRCDGVQVGMTWRSRSSPKVETGGVGPARGHGHAYEAVLRFGFTDSRVASFLVVGALILRVFAVRGEAGSPYVSL